MNPSDVLKYGNQTVMRTLENFPESEWNTPGACGYWSVKDLMAHLSSFEMLLVEILNTFLDPGPTPTMEAFAAQGVDFNDKQVDLRKSASMPQILDEYNKAYKKVSAAAPKIPAATWTQNGILPWYGEGYDLEDFIVYTFYAHKREHCGQIAVFNDQFK